MIFDAPNRNRFWADLIVEELDRCGVGYFCLAPGSRSTPLTTAVAAHPRARHLIHYDERGTAFFALGYARATGRPAVWITTSGTAVANGLPAVVEAATDGVPLILLTADRPPELRDTGANQTITQPHIFGQYARWHADFPPPDPAIDPAMVLTTVDQAVYRARRAPSGPVHLNCMFREPLAPEPDGVDYGRTWDRLEEWYTNHGVYTEYAQPEGGPSAFYLNDFSWSFRESRPGLVIAGRLTTRAEGEAAARLADALGWPLLPDIGSQVRLGMGDERVNIPYFDQILASEAFKEAHKPEVVIQLGGRSTSKRLLQYLGRRDLQLYVVAGPTPFRHDPNHLVTNRFETDVVAFCDGLLDVVKRGPARWLDDWQEANQKAAAVIQSTLDEADELSEPLVARLISHHIPEEHGLILASSMPVRDMDMFAIPDGPPAPVASNRGASGIDGTIATAAGFSAGLKAPATLLIGDLAMLHDLNSLALLREHPLVIVAINNDGGGIFHFLPIARHEGVFEPYFGTPHGLTFEAAAEMFGLTYGHPSTPSAFRHAYRAACARPTATLIEVTTDRTANHALHRLIQERIVASLA